MLKNYLTTALRHILKNRLFSAINIFGLAVGMMSCILILLYVKAETSYDKWIPESEKIVRLHSAYYSPGRPPFLTVASAGRLMEAITSYAEAEVEAGVRLLRDSGLTIIQGDTAFSETAFYADPSFFSVFDLPLAHGSAATAFANPLDLVISEKMARKYFGRTDVVGETITACCLPRDRMDLKISGVLKDMPQASHFDIDFLILMDPAMFDFAPNILNTWTSVNTYTYFKLRDGVTASDLQERYEHWLNTESPFVDMLKQRGLEGKVTDTNKGSVMPLEDLHLNARKAAGNMPDLSAMGDIKMIYTFVVVAGLVLLIASINFMNLSTARAAKRAREVALRKVMGASRRQIALQFLGEAVAVAGLGFLFALVGVELMLPLYSEAIGREIELNLLGDMVLLLSLVGVALSVGLISGTYPAAFLSRFLPARILRANNSADSEGGSSFRSALVIFQFAISIGLAVCTAVVYGQTLYAQNMDVGYKYDGKMVLGNLRALSGAEQGETLRRELEQIPGVTSVVVSSDVPSQDRENNTGFRKLERDNQADADGGVTLNYYSVGYDFMEAYQIKPLAGRTFDRAFGTDMITPIPASEERIGVAGLMINEAAMRALGYTAPEETIGKVLQADVFRSGTHNLTIIGVIPDIYFRSIKHGIRASAYFMNPSNYRVATINFEASDPAVLRRAIEQVWRENVPLTPISLRFLSDMMNAQYDSETRQAKLFAAFSVLAIVVACLGLFGLASFTAEQRTKEIGIRKILGATAADIIRLLVWQFSKPVLIANIIAWPAAWYLMSGWLEGFEYRLESSFLLTAALVASLVALIVAWLTVASRAYRVARTNPIHALRYE
jgi:putative ABC transport system permease protein